MLTENERIIAYLAIIGGLSVIGAIVAWLAGLVSAVLLKRPVMFGEWVAHGAGAGGVFGIILVILDLAL